MSGSTTGGLDRGDRRSHIERINPGSNPAHIPGIIGLRPRPIPAPAPAAPTVDLARARVEAEAPALAGAIWDRIDARAAAVPGAET